MSAAAAAAAQPPRRRARFAPAPAAPSRWQRALDADGAPYWYSRDTRATTRYDPALPWVRLESAKGPFWLCPATGAKTWRDPRGGAGQAVIQPTAEQCAVLRGLKERGYVDKVRKVVEERVEGAREAFERGLWEEAGRIFEGKFGGCEGVQRVTAFEEVMEGLKNGECMRRYREAVLGELRDGRLMEEVIGWDIREVQAEVRAEGVGMEVGSDREGVGVGGEGGGVDGEGRGGGGDGKELENEAPGTGGAAAAGSGGSGKVEVRKAETVGKKKAPGLSVGEFMSSWKKPPGSSTPRPTPPVATLVGGKAKALPKPRVLTAPRALDAAPGAGTSGSLKKHAALAAVADSRGSVTEKTEAGETNGSEPPLGAFLGNLEKSAPSSTPRLAPSASKAALPKARSLAAPRALAAAQESTAQDEGRKKATLGLPPKQLPEVLATLAKSKDKTDAKRWALATPRALDAAQGPAAEAEAKAGGPNAVVDAANVTKMPTAADVPDGEKTSLPQGTKRRNSVGYERAGDVLAPVNLRKGKDGKASATSPEAETNGAEALPSEEAGFHPMDVSIPAKADENPQVEMQPLRNDEVLAELPSEQMRTGIPSNPGDSRDPLTVEDAASAGRKIHDVAGESDESGSERVRGRRRRFVVCDESEDDEEGEDYQSGKGSVPVSDSPETLQIEGATSLARIMEEETGNVALMDGAVVAVDGDGDKGVHSKGKTRLETSADDNMETASALIDQPRAIVDDDVNVAAMNSVGLDTGSLSSEEMPGEIKADSPEPHRGRGDEETDPRPSGSAENRERRAGRPKRSKGRKIRARVNDDPGRDGAAAVDGVGADPLAPTQPDLDGLLRVRNALDEIMRMPEAEAFLKPVDSTVPGCEDYYQEIATPIDLGTIKNRMPLPGKSVRRKSWYKTVSQVLADVELVWQNCFSYNGERDSICVCARECRIRFGLLLEKEKMVDGVGGITGFGGSRRKSGRSTKGVPAARLRHDSSDEEEEEVKRRARRKKEKEERRVPCQKRRSDSKDSCKATPAAASSAALPLPRTLAPLSRPAGGPKGRTGQALVGATLAVFTCKVPGLETQEGVAEPVRVYKCRVHSYNDVDGTHCLKWEKTQLYTYKARLEASMIVLNQGDDPDWYQVMG